MYLYEKSKDNKEILIYEMNFDKEKMSDYKREEMQKLPLEDRVYKAFTDDYRILEYDEAPNWQEIKKGARHLMTPFEDDDLLEQYYDGKFRNCFPISADISFVDKKRLLLTKQYSKQKKDFYVMNGIIHLPESLYALQILENGKFYMLENTRIDISDQLQLFTYSKDPVCEIKTDTIDNMSKYGLVGPKFPVMLDNDISHSTKVLEKVRELNLIK